MARQCEAVLKKPPHLCHGRGLPGPIGYGGDIGQVNTHTSGGLDDRQYSAAQNRVPQRRILSVRDAALYLGRTEKSVRHLVQKHKLRAIRADGRVMLDLFDLDAWIEMHRV